MSTAKPPIFSFDRLKPVTMTVIVSYDVIDLNLGALFAFLPVTDQVLPANLNIQKKQGKIRLPAELNRPGEILSMRYDKKIRGIIRSEHPKSFSHSIIIDIGTSERIISAKLSKTLEFTGPTSIAIAREAAENLPGHIKKIQEDLKFIRENRDRALIIKDEFISEMEPHQEDPIDFRLWNIFKQQTRGYSSPERMNEFLNFMISFNRDLYTGTLELGEFQCEMANVLFNLGYPINQVNFANIMNTHPFRSGFNNFKSTSAVVVCYDYIKYDRATGQAKQANHTIRVNRSGHVRYSGPNLKAMEEVYYAFMQRVLQHYEEIESVDTRKQQLMIIGPSRPISVNEWRNFIKKEEELREKVLHGDVPIAKGEFNPQAPVFEIIEPSFEIIDTPLLGLDGMSPISAISPPPTQSLNFDYTPLIARR